MAVPAPDPVGAGGRLAVVDGAGACSYARPMAVEPAVRARHMKSIVATIERLPPREGDAVRNALGLPTLRTIADASGMDWLPLSVNLEATHAIHAGLGPEGFRALFHDMQLESFRGPLLKYVVDTAIQLFGLDPASWARWIPRGWGLVFRDCGAWRVERAEPGRARLSVEGLPPACSGDPVWLASVAAALSALIDLARTRGTFELLEVDGAAGRATYEMRWEPQPARR